MNKLWEKNFEVNAEIERFTVGRDREMDLYLAKYDVLGSMAHITMLDVINNFCFRIFKIFYIIIFIKISISFNQIIKYI